MREKVELNPKKRPNAEKMSPESSLEKGVYGGYEFQIDGGDSVVFKLPNGRKIEIGPDPGPSRDLSMTQWDSAVSGILADKNSRLPLMIYRTTDLNVGYGITQNAKEIPVDTKKVWGLSKEDADMFLLFADTLLSRYIQAIARSRKNPDSTI